MHSTADPRAMFHRLCGLGGFLLFVGVAGFVGIRLGEARANATARWPSVTGRIVTSEVSTATVKTGPVRRTTPVARIRYAYSVNGQRLEGDGLRVIPMLHFKPEGTPEELVARYPVGKSVEVFYDPNNPKDALLTPAAAADARDLIRSLAFIAPCVGFVGLLLAIIGGVQLVTDRRATPAALSSVAPRGAELPRASAPAFHAQPPPARPAAPATPPAALAPPRETHRLVRGAATALGLCFLLFGSLLFVTAARMSNPSICTAVHVTTLVIVGGIALFGGFLVCVGMRKPRLRALAS